MLDFDSIQDVRMFYIIGIIVILLLLLLISFILTSKRAARLESLLEECQHHLARDNQNFQSLQQAFLEFRDNSIKNMPDFRELASALDEIDAQRQVLSAAIEKLEQKQNDQDVKLSSLDKMQEISDLASDLENLRGQIAHCQSSLQRQQEKQKAQQDELKRLKENQAFQPQSSFFPTPPLGESRPLSPKMKHDAYGQGSGMFQGGIFNSDSQGVKYVDIETPSRSTLFIDESAKEFSKNEIIPTSTPFTSEGKEIESPIVRKPEGESSFFRDLSLDGDKKEKNVALDDATKSDESRFDFLNDFTRLYNAAHQQRQETSTPALPEDAPAKIELPPVESLSPEVKAEVTAPKTGVATPLTPESGDSLHDFMQESRAKADNKMVQSGSSLTVDFSQGVDHPTAVTTKKKPQNTATVVDMIYDADYVRKQKDQKPNGINIATLDKAHTFIDAGVPLAEISAKTGLSEDELRLLYDVDENGKIRVPENFASAEGEEATTPTGDANKATEISSIEDRDKEAESKDTLENEIKAKEKAQATAVPYGGEPTLALDTTERQTIESMMRDTGTFAKSGEASEESTLKTANFSGEEVEDFARSLDKIDKLADSIISKNKEQDRQRREQVKLQQQQQTAPAAHQPYIKQSAFATAEKPATSHIPEPISSYDDDPLQVLDDFKHKLQPPAGKAERDVLESSNEAYLHDLKAGIDAALDFEDDAVVLQNTPLPAKPSVQHRQQQTPKKTRPQQMPQRQQNTGARPAGVQAKAAHPQQTQSPQQRQNRPVKKAAQATPLNQQGKRGNQASVKNPVPAQNRFTAPPQAPRAMASSTRAIDKVSHNPAPITPYKSTAERAQMIAAQAQQQQRMASRPLSVGQVSRPQPQGGFSPVTAMNPGMADVMHAPLAVGSLEDPNVEEDPATILNQVVSEGMQSVASLGADDISALAQIQQVPLEQSMGGTMPSPVPQKPRHIANRKARNAYGIN